jgi:hypothetical protein
MARNNNLRIPSKVIVILLVSAGSVMSSAAYGGEDGDSSETNVDQETKQNQKCKIGGFGDPDDSSSTVLGHCSQQAQNNIDADSPMGGIRIMTP